MGWRHFKNKTNKITDPALLCCDYSRERHLNWPIILCCCPIKLVATEIFDVSNCFTRSDCWLPLHNNSKPITNNRLVLTSHSRNKHIICSEPRMTLGIINGIFFFYRISWNQVRFISPMTRLCLVFEILDLSVWSGNQFVVFYWHHISVDSIFKYLCD